MAGTLQLEIATPERLLVQADATEVYVPGADGMLGILPEHAALLSESAYGELTFVRHRDELGLRGRRLGPDPQQRSAGACRSRREHQRDRYHPR